MPGLKRHCQISRQNTGGKRGYEDLHKWMDAEQKHLGENHRLIRHDLLWLNAVKEKFKHYPQDELVIEFVNHIVEDYKDTLKKLRYNFEKGKR